MTTLGVQHRDHTGKSSRWAHIVVPMIVAPIALGCGGAGAMTALLAVPAAGTGGAVWRGVRTWHDTSDPTIVERHWTRPQWLRLTGFVVVAVCAALALFYVVADPFASGYQWLVNLAGWGGALAVLGWLAFGEKVRERRAGPTPEASALARINATHFVQAGLAIKSPNSGLHITPELAYADHDERGNPFYVAQLLAGHQTLADWQKAGPRLASAWEVPRVEVTDEGTNRVRVTAILREFSRSGTLPYEPVPHPEHVPVVEYVKALPMGAHAFGPEPWTLSLYETHWLVGGVTRMGKSVGMNVLMGHLARHPHIEMSMIDLKEGVEAEPWRPRLSGIARTRKAAVKMLAWLLLDMIGRFARMRRAGVKNAWTHPGFLGADEPLKVIVIDELAELFEADAGMKEQRVQADRARLILGSFIRRCSAAGYVFIGATQRPSADAVPTAIRSQAGGRMAYRCEGDTMAALILGTNWYGNSSGPEGDPGEIGVTQKGMVVIKTETGEYVRMQTSLISDEQVQQIAAETTAYRRAWDWKGTDVEEALRIANDDEDDDDDGEDDDVRPEPWASVPVDVPEPEPTRSKDGPAAGGLPDDDDGPDETAPVSTGRLYDEPPPPSAPDLHSMVYGATEDRSQGDDPDPDPEPEQPPKKTRDTSEWEF